MKKRIIKRILIGFPVGIFIAVVIHVIISWAIGGGDYRFVVPGFREVVPMEIAAVTLQYFLSGLMGVGCFVSALVFEIDSWSLLKQTVVNFLCVVISVLPIAYICHWMDHSLWGILFYLGIFMVVYVIIWLVEFFCWKRSIKKINDHLEAS